MKQRHEKMSEKMHFTAKIFNMHIISMGLT